MKTTLKSFLESLDINESSPTVKIITAGDENAHRTDEWLKRLPDIDLEETADWQLEDGGDSYQYVVVK